MGCETLERGRCWAGCTGCSTLQAGTLQLAWSPTTQFAPDPVSCAAAASVPEHVPEPRLAPPLLGHECGAPRVVRLRQYSSSGAVQ